MCSLYSAVKCRRLGSAATCGSTRHAFEAAASIDDCIGARLHGHNVAIEQEPDRVPTYLVVAVCEGISATLRGTALDSAAATTLDSGYGAGSMLLAVASVVGGTVILRRRLLPGLGRWSVLASGLFMIVDRAGLAPGHGRRRPARGAATRREHPEHRDQAARPLTLQVAPHTASSFLDDEPLPSLPVRSFAMSAPT